MAAIENRPTANIEPSPSLTGIECADDVFNQYLKTAQTLGDVRRGVAILMEEVSTDTAARSRIQNLQTSVEHITQGHEDIRLEDDLGAGVLGVNERVGTTQTAMRRDQMEAEGIAKDPDSTLDIALHERSKKLGHAGQDPNARLAVIDERGQYKGPEVGFEGNVVANVADFLGKKRADIPERKYGEGERLVRGIGVKVVDTYVHIGGANVGRPLQIELWRKQPDIPFQDMLAQGQRIGLSEQEVYTIAEELGRKDVRLVEDSSLAA